MEAIDRVFIMKELTSSKGQTVIKAMTGAEAYNHFLTLGCSAPTIDPIRAAGGCRCGECKHHKPIDYCGLHRTTGWFDNRHCSYSEPREARAMAEWISVKERLPEHGRDVLMHHDRNGGEIGVGWYAEDRPHWVKDGAMLIANVTHWMPLPEPPKEDEEQ